LIKHALSLMVAGLYFATIILPYYLTTIAHVMSSKNILFSLHGGFFHLPSLVFIILSALFLHASVNSKTTKAAMSHKRARKTFHEAIEIFSLSNETRANDFIESENAYCKDIKKVILNGGIEEDIEMIVQKHVSSITTSYEKLISEYGYISTVLPMLGMVGTITGLLQMFAISDGVDNFADKLAGLSVALATTLYATLWVVFITKPQSREVENWLIELDEDEFQLVISAKLFLHNVDIHSLHEIEMKKEEINNGEVS